MDIATHALVGAAIGLNYNAPVMGAVIGAAPDLVLGVKRKLNPTKLYKLTHSFLVCAVVGLGLYYSGLTSLLVFQAWLSHIVLDAVTHSNEWAPRPFYPFTERTFKLNIPEWEFGNSTWYFGILFSIMVVLLCLPK